MGFERGACKRPSPRADSRVGRFLTLTLIKACKRQKEEEEKEEVEGKKSIGNQQVQSLIDGSQMHTSSNSEMHISCQSI